MPVIESKHYLCLLALSLSVNAGAQDADDAIAACARISSTGDRILCLETALRSQPAPEAEPVAALPEVDDEVLTNMDVSTAAAEIAAPTPEMSKEISSASKEETASVAEVVVSKPDIGSEQVAARTMTSEERRAALASATNQRVAQYSMVPYERLVVKLENGQTWRQIKGDVQRIRVNLKKNQTVDITESRLGGYQLRLNEMRRTIRVERIK